MSTVKDTDPATDLMLDFIAQDESGGNYNAVIGNGNATDDLSKKTLTDIYALQAALVSAGKPSGAVGRYQFIHSTLVADAAKLAIDPGSYFTPKLQDKLAVQKLVDRGYSQWWMGQLGDSDFAHNLSMEWASLPDPANNAATTGKVGHYPGQNPKRTVQYVLDKLAAVRALIAPTPAPLPEPTVPLPAPPPAAGDPIAAAVALIDARIAKLQTAREVLVSLQGQI